MALAQLEIRHPIENLGRIEIAENPPLEFEQERGMQGIGKVEKNIRRGQPGAQFAPGKTGATQRIEIMGVARCFLVKKAITSGEPVGAELPLEICDASLVARAVLRRWQQFDPDRVLLQAAQSEHPL